MRGLRRSGGPAGGPVGPVGPIKQGQHRGSTWLGRAGQVGFPRAGLGRTGKMRLIGCNRRGQVKIEVKKEVRRAVKER